MMDRVMIGLYLAGGLLLCIGGLIGSGFVYGLIQRVMGNTNE